MALQTNIVKKSGSWFTYDGDQLGQGRENVRQFLKDNAELTSEIENRVKMEFGLIPRPEDSEDASGDKNAGDGGNNGTDGPHDNDAAAGVESADASAK
jgi:recombination protein RecA